VNGFVAEIIRLQSICTACTREHATRLVRAYGTLARHIVAGIRTQADWGEVFGADLTEREVRYLMDREWAVTADDVLWRRSKLGYRLTAAEARRLDDWMRHAAAAPERRPVMAGGGVS
jgi:glycerol-3-phosphate dehydrogenase